MLNQIDALRRFVARTAWRLRRVAVWFSDRLNRLLFPILYRLAVLFHPVPDLLRAGGVKPRAGKRGMVGAFNKRPGGWTGNDASLDHPVLKKLQQVALRDLWEMIGLDAPIPATVWRLLDTYPDPDRVLDAFVRGAGCDLLSLLRGDPDERARLDNVVDMLLQYDLVSDVIDKSEVIRSALEKLLRAGKKTEFIHAVQVASLIARILDGARGIDSTYRFPRYDALIVQIEQWARNPLVASIRSAKAVEVECSKLEALATRFAEAASSFERYRDEALAIFPEWLQGAGIDTRLNECDYQFRERCCDLRTETLTTDEITPLVEDLETYACEIQAILNELIAAIRSDRDAGSASADDTDFDSAYRDTAPPLSERERALETLGFDRSQTPTKEEIKSRYRQYARKYHPDWFTDPADKRRQNEQMSRINGAYEFLSGKKPSFAAS